MKIAAVPLLALVVACLGMVGCGDAKSNEAPVGNEADKEARFVNEASPRLKAGKEILVSKDVFVYTQLWCQGSDKLVYSKRDEGLYYYEPKTGESTLAADDYNTPIACSPDGEWLVYMDEDSYRYHENDANNPLIADVWRYEFKTGERQKILVKRQEDSVAFDKKAFSWAEQNKLCVDAEEIEGVEMPEPRWETGWENRGCAEWIFSDGSAITGVHQEGGVLVIDVLSPKNEPGKIYTPFSRFDIEFVDKNDRLFLYVYKSKDDGNVQRCEVDRENEKLSCENVLENIYIDNRNYGFFSDGDKVAFLTSNTSGDDCVKIAHVGDVVEDAPCVTSPTANANYYYYSVTLSPDDKRLAVGIGTERSGDGEDPIYDLYIRNLEE